MSEIDLIYETKVKHEGIFNFKDLYNFVYDYLTDKGYTVIEENYTEKVKADGKEIEVKWKALKKITDYFRFQIKVNFKILRLVDVELTREGKKIKSNKGEVEVKFSAFLERDYENKFEVSPFHKFLRALYEKYIIKNRIEQMEDKLVDETLDVVNQTKAYLVLEIA